jgi:hypothetical protein
LDCAKYDARLFDVVDTTSLKINHLISAFAGVWGKISKTVVTTCTHRRRGTDGHFRYIKTTCSKVHHLSSDGYVRRGVAEFVPFILSAKFDPNTLKAHVAAITRDKEAFYNKYASPTEAVAITAADGDVGDVVDATSDTMEGQEVVSPVVTKNAVASPATLIILLISNQ